ncbi:ABC transporter type 1, transmembrane domain-containing protein [Dactylonectria macrodidyma]|uniref:ABC transporter type 1, transmembrane domain-containing protein n=1 Tax=Dactylonectria macrodidyma TaxID=307937 RepID=A0A9P9IMH4_9HYPO|nr:ABC transporter type 1, transmembrane domain-containing protein [Dactylonectria macrodidyma]
MARQAMRLEAIERRIAVTSQILKAMKGVKMCGLTDVLGTRIQAMRTEELHISGKFRRLLIWNMLLAYLAPILTFTAYSLLAQAQKGGGNLDTNRMFTSLSLFALLQDPLASFVTSLSSLMGSIGCSEQIQSFLNSDVHVDDRVIQDGNKCDGSWTSRSSGSAIEKDSLPEEEPKLLKNPAPKRLLNGNAVVVKAGAFGYGTTKEPILSDINATVPLGKFTMLVGPVGSGKSTLLKAFLGEVGIMAGSIQISSSKIAYCDQTPWHMNGTQVLEACAFKQGLAQLPKGDLTTIGSKGIILSGGQSQRVSLARAVYAQKDTIILDDVFSGLDAHTDNAVFHNLLGTHGILRQFKATVIIASSRAKRLPYAGHIIRLDGTGRGCEEGSFDKLTSSGGYVSRPLVSSADWTYAQTPAAPTESTADALVNSEVALLEDFEDRAGRRTGDVPTFIFVFTIYAFIFCQSFPTIWLNWWAAANAKDPSARLGYDLGIYAMLGVLAIVFLVASTWQMIVTMIPLSGNNFHRSLFMTVLDAPMSFFAATDAGITINRFSQDLQLIDMDLPISALNTFATFVLCIAQMALIATGSYYTAFAFPFLFAALWVIQHAYLRTSRQLRFMDLEAKSPLYALFIESVTGLATLRAFGWRDALEKKHHGLLDRSQRPFYLLYAIQRWLTFVLDMFVTGIAVLLIVLVTQLRGILPAGLIGVALVSVIQFSQNLKLLMTFWTNLETHIGAISRIKSFTSHTASEHEPQEKEQPPSVWPSKGTIVFDNVSAGYRCRCICWQNEHVLKNISLSIEAGQKVGICGRTGSGRITVDGLDIATLPREEVRTCSVRFNVDLCEGLVDAAIEDALKVVELWDTVAEKGGLDVPIEDLHFSHGQKQLFCLARDMLRPSPVVVLDEATSSVDSHTDELVQRVVRERFSNRTVIAIVHKLESALEDFEMVALLDAGELQEFGSPRGFVEKGPEVSAFAALYESLAMKKKEA